MKINKRTAVILSAAVISVGAFFICRSDKPLNGKDVILASDNALEGWLNLKGWKVSAPVCSEVTVPEDFTGVYSDYALIQQKQHLPLEEYKGRKVMRYLYNVENCGGDVPVTAELLISDDKLIAAALFENKRDGKITEP